MATSLICSNCTFSTTFLSSGTRSGPKGATSSGRETRRLIFSMTMAAIRLCSASFSLSPRLRTGQRMARVLASTAATKVVAMSFSSALTVSEGLTMASTTAGTAGATSVLLLVAQHTRRASFAARVTCVLVSHTCAVAIGTMRGSMLEITAGCLLDSDTRPCSATYLVRQSAEPPSMVPKMAARTTGRTARRWARETAARKASSAASRTAPLLEAHSIRIFLRRGIT
mmetsp:Transcript_24686/g.56729  ORF Transcript_24686/g.56729 Transcript_24686/m.56729 type:complete len:227 (+) Transcript_24686:494-1174(+)